MKFFFCGEEIYSKLFITYSSVILMCYSARVITHQALLRIVARFKVFLFFLFLGGGQIQFKWPRFLVLLYVCDNFFWTQQNLGSTKQIWGELPLNAPRG